MKPEELGWDSVLIPHWQNYVSSDNDANDDDHRMAKELRLAARSELSERGVKTKDRGAVKKA